MLYVFLTSAVQYLYMVKVDSKRLNVRLRRPVAFALEELAEQWGCSQTAALERAILDAHGGVPRTVMTKPDGRAVLRTDEPELRIEYDEG